MIQTRVIEIFKQSATYALGKMLINQTQDFFETLGEMGIRTWQVFYLTLKALVQRQMKWKLIIEQCSRFAVDSLPITLTIVGMVSGSIE